MSILNGLLKHLRRAPEPLKRRLRPALVHAVAIARAMPGGKLGFALARRLAPGLHGWLRRRYLYYVDNAVGAPVAAPRADAAGLDADALIVLGRLRRAGDGRVN